MPDIFEKIAEAVIEGNIEETGALTRQALDRGAKAKEVLERGLLPGMDTVGQRFKFCEMFIPEVLRSAKSMHGAMDILKPLLSESEAAGSGTVVIGTVEGDLHDIGKNLVAMMLEGAGFGVVDLGINVGPQAFVDAVKVHNPGIVAMSALLTTTMPKMKETIEALKEASVRERVKVMAGGAPVTEDYVQKIGGDAYAPNAAVAVEKARSLVER